MTTATKYVEPTGNTKAGYASYKRPPTAWELYQKEQGIPVFTGIGVRDARELPRKEWEQLGGKGTFVQLAGTNNRTGVFVVEIPARGALKPQKHLWEERYLVLEGRGSTEVWKDASSARTSFEWQKDSLFSVPINANFRIINSTSSPAVLMAINSAPTMINIFQSKSFIFDNPVDFDDRFGGNLEDYWKPVEEFEPHPSTGRALLRTNIFPDAATTYLPLDNNRGPGHRYIWPAMTGNTTVGGFIAGYPPGRYSKAHHHASGIILICLAGSGYTLNWPKDQGGITPWKDGKGDLVKVQDYVAGGIVAAAPTTGQETWFHQHFATGKEGVRVHAIGAGMGGAGSDEEGDERPSVGVNITNGGTAIPYYLEDPHIREYYKEQIAKNGVEFTMPEEVYSEAGDKASVHAVD